MVPGYEFTEHLLSFLQAPQHETNLVGCERERVVQMTMENVSRHEPSNKRDAAVKTNATAEPIPIVRAVVVDAGRCV